MQDQTFDHSLFEMVIADDGSTDDTESIFNALKEKVDFDIIFMTQKY